MTRGSYFDLSFAGGGLPLSKKELEAKLAELKSDYVRIQEDLEKLVFVGGRESSAEEQLIRLEKEIAEVREKIAAFD